MSLFTALTVSAQEICDNGIDDDGDGLIDFRDDDCPCLNTTTCDIVPLTDVSGNPCTRVDLILEVSGATSFQWHKDGVALENEDDSEIEIHKFAPLGEGCYQVVVETPTGCVASEPYKVIQEEFEEDLGIISVCEGDTVVIGGFAFATEGKQQFKTQTSEGCDSSVCLTIVFVDATIIPDRLALCEGATYVSPSGNVTTTTDLMTTDTIRSVAGCDSILYLIDVTFEPLETQMMDTTICARDTFRFKDLVATESGTYTVMSQDPIFGCDSTFVIDLFVNEEITSSFSASICQGSVYEFEDLRATESGEYPVTFQSAEGCDSIVTVILTVDPPIEETITGSYCRGQVYTRGDFSTDTEGTFEHMSNLGECDSLITFIIEESDVQESLEQMEVCQGGSVEWRGMTLSEDGRFEDLETTPGECDVLHVLELTLTQPEPIMESGSVCRGLAFEWRGMMLTEAGTYEDIVEAVGQCTEIYQLELIEEDLEVRSISPIICFGETYTEFGLNEREPGFYEATESVAGQCDILYEIDLRVRAEAIGDTMATLCPGETFELYNLSTTEPGSHMAITQNAMGCDSTIMVELSQGLPDEQTEIMEICEGDVFEYEGQEITEEGMHEFLLESVDFPCGIRKIIDLRFSDEIGVEVNPIICEGEVFERHDLVLTETGTYLTTFVDPDGCDSLITVNLTVNPISESSLDVFICRGDSYDLLGEIYKDPGTYTGVTTNFTGCDSTITVVLDFYPDILPTEFDAEICEGEVYTFEDIEETESGIYETMVPSFNGCDSTIIINLDVLPINTREDFVEICPGDIVTFFGTEITEPGIYEEQFSNAVGCDSIVSLVVDFDSELGDFQLIDTITISIGEELDLAPTEVDENFVSFHWINPEGDIISTSRELEGFMPLQDTYLDLEAVSINGCEVVKRVRIDVELIVDIYTPNVIRLGEDDFNSRFTVGANASVVGIQELRILDRWGETVFVDSHDGNLDTYIGWDGKFRGKEVQPAVFAFFAIFEIIDGSTVKKSGSLTVLK